MARTLVIAEPGSTGEADLPRFYRLIDVAAAAGADVFKAQWCSAPEQLAAQRHAPEYLDTYRFLAFPADWHAQLAFYCTTRGLKYGVSVYRMDDVEPAAMYASLLKISSFEADTNLVDRALLTTCRVVVSTGMLEETRLRQLTLLRDRYYVRLRVLHCVSSYPAPLAEMNLDVMRRYCLDGLSDHSRHPLMGAIAVGAGARVIETHYRLDDTDPANPDYNVAFTPAQFADYVTNVRLAEQAMGWGRKQLQPCEEPMAHYRVKS